MTALRIAGPTLLFGGAGRRDVFRDGYRRVGVAMKKMPRGPVEQRFWAKVKRGPDCWLWTGATTRGYGHIKRGPANAGTAQATHLSWEIHNGPIPDGLMVLHHCDNPPCVNPEHLYLGTHKDNMRDRAVRGRSRGGLAQESLTLFKRN